MEIIVKGKYVYTTIKVKREFNKLIYQTMTTQEMNFLNLLLSKASQQKEKQTDTVKIDIDELINYDLFDPEFVRKKLYNKGYKMFLQKFMKKQLNIRIYDKEKNNYYGVIFGEYVIIENPKTEKENTVIFSLTNLGREFTKNLDKEFFKYYYQEYLLIKGKHAKRLYTELRQYETTGTMLIAKQELIAKLEAEKYEKNRNFETKLLKPALNELKIIYPNIKFERVQKGKEIIGYAFKFKANSKLIWRKKEPVKGNNETMLEQDLDDYKDEIRRFKRETAFDYMVAQHYYQDARDIIKEATETGILSTGAALNLRRNLEKVIEEYNKENPLKDY